MTIRALSVLPRAWRWQPSLYVLAVLAACAQPPPPPAPTEAVRPTEQAPPGPGRIEPCECGPIDVVFVIDDTGSMRSPLTAFKAGFPQLVTEIGLSSSSDYRMGLVTFKDTVTVLDDLAAGNDASVLNHVANLTAGGGGGEPEASDEALDTVLNNLPAHVGQTGNFSGYWRTGARRFVVLLTDARPGGFDSVYVAGTDDVHAHAQAVTAAIKEIKLHAVYAASGTPNPTIASVMQDYAATSHGLYRQTQPNNADMYAAVRDFLSGCRTASDVWMQDHPSDTGMEPNALSPWASPDINVCNSASGCAWPGNSPVYGAPGLNHVFVTLRNDGPNVTPHGYASGSLYLYYIGAGGNASWGSTDWTPIGVQHGVFMAPGEHREVRIPWDNVPLPGHYCLLARWVSAGDPMTYPELIPSNTVTNTNNNNNIAWRNVDVGHTLPGNPVRGTFTWTDAPGAVSTLAIEPVAAVPGKVVLDLGDLFDGWKANGGKGTGFEAIGGTQLLISDGGGAVDGVPAPKQGRAAVALSFTLDKVGTWPVRVRQLSNGKEDRGGVEYQVVVVSPDAPAKAPTVAAIGDDRGVTIAWTHDVQHVQYVVWRSGQPDFRPGEGEPIAELDAKDADEKSALTFTDPAGTDTLLYYRVQSRSRTSDAFSDVVTASAVSNPEK